MTDHIYGHFVVRGPGGYEHRIPVHYAPDSSNFDRVEDGLYRRVDFERGFYFEWEPA